ncbi:hypothetical protein V5N11_020831 [Cardamine amara subsp. amara]|uniref:Transposase MuDR plant domain-containing protein n=1 Tax=Cardamine amara subsp. amara TaxID=228776 RepID=A0ABD1AJ43_CARAN
MRTAVGVYAVKRYFNFEQVKSDKLRLIVECVDIGCPWRAYGLVVEGGSESIEIRTATLMHTCDVAMRSGYGKRDSAKVIAEVLRSKYSNGKEGPMAADVPAIVLDELKVSVRVAR